MSYDITALSSSHNKLDEIHIFVTPNFFIIIIIIKASETTGICNKLNWNSKLKYSMKITKNNKPAWVQYQIKNTCSRIVKYYIIFLNTVQYVALT